MSKSEWKTFNFSKKRRSGKNDIDKLESVLNEKIKEQSNYATKLLSETNERLKNVISKKKFSEISMAQGVLEGTKKKKKSTN